ncbi:MAG: hypothetical protein ACD_13C00234G0001 [uncultured bacterium]|nr:MAG: hypothetical protein ACD_13C00234G0001 [uncultured bacterium]
MPATPEVPRPEAPQVSERQEEFVIPETLQQKTGIQVVQKNFKAQIKDDHGIPLIQTPPSHVIEVTPPADAKTLEDWSKGSVDSSQTWLGAFWQRVIKKAIHFGWRIAVGGKQI